MGLKETIIKKIEKTLEFLLSKVLNFLRFLKSKHGRENLETMLLSESSLTKDWLKSEEDEAWQDL